MAHNYLCGQLAMPRKALEMDFDHLRTFLNTVGALLSSCTEEGSGGSAYLQSCVMLRKTLRKTWPDPGDFLGGVDAKLATFEGTDQLCSGRATLRKALGQWGLPALLSTAWLSCMWGGPRCSWESAAWIMWPL